ncbi:hypothetical protein [Escherichia coli]
MPVNGIFDVFDMLSICLLYTSDAADDRETVFKSWLWPAH